jgi:hypothetical protein
MEVHPFLRTFLIPFEAAFRNPFMCLLEAFGNPFVTSLAAPESIFNRRDLSLRTPITFGKIRKICKRFHRSVK